MVRRSNKQRCGGPFVNSLKQDVNYTLELANVLSIISALGECVEFVQQQYTRLRACM
ncbi:hypothetical protein GCM10007898_26070 [Dyella flagellata]|uniref:Uncharacterized protein n=1 Tax=Dyella flagellata TaxID=1867833 RepID=A0ABQ5XBG6_9GAMM|nr:hypothetical protein GCM10007898_26070 [Dyella flagellata]